MSRYYTLKQLFERGGNLRNKLVFRVQRKYRGEEKNHYQIFSICEYLQYRKENTLSQHVCLHEFIAGSLPRKLYIDLDIEGERCESFDPNVFFDRLEHACQQELPDFQSKYLNVYSAHSTVIDATRKLSYHIIIQGYQVSEAYEARAWITRIWQHMDPVIQPDWGVYSNNACLRAAGWCKLGTLRIKQLDVHNRTQFKRNSQFKMLMAGFVTHIVREKPLPTQRVTFAEEQIELDIDAEAALAFLPNRDEFRVRKQKGCIIILDQHAERSPCPTCKIVHHAENPYLIIDGREVYWCCRRVSTRTLLGVLDAPKKIESEVHARGPCSEESGFSTDRIHPKYVESKQSKTMIRPAVGTVREKHTAIVLKPRRLMLQVRVTPPTTHQLKPRKHTPTTKAHGVYHSITSDI